MRASRGPVRGHGWSHIRTLNVTLWISRCSIYVATMEAVMSSALGVSIAAAQLIVVLFFLRMLAISLSDSPVGKGLAFIIGG